MLNKREVKVMDRINILLCCGVGMSSGFLAQKARQAAKKNHIEANIEARSHSDISSYLDHTDVLMIGPHYGGQLREFENMAMPYHTKVCIIPKDIYSQLDGKALLELAMSLTEEK